MIKWYDILCATLYVGSNPTIGKFLYVAQADERVLAVAFRKNYVGSSPTIGIFFM